MRILVTGGEGFIGKYVMSRGRELGYSMESMDISNPDMANVAYDGLWPWKQKYDVVIHLAGLLGTHELWDEPFDAIETNIMGAINAGQFAFEKDAQLVCIEQPHIWYNVYEATKLAARRILTGMHYDQGLKVEFVRAHNAFGPGQAYGEGHPQKIIPTFSVKAWRGEPIPIWGDGDQSVNLVYAGDVADTLLTAANSPMQSINYTWEAGSNELWTVNAVANWVIDHVAVKGGPNSAKDHMKMRKGEQPDQSYPSPTKFYRHTLDLEKLNATIDWYKQYT